MIRQPAPNSRGVCLVEVIIAMAVGLVVFMATLQSLDHFERRLSMQHVAVARAQDLRIGLRVLEDDVRTAGAASWPSEPPLTTAGPQEVEFDANLGGLVTTLTAPVSSGQQELPVTSGAGWPKGKRILVCDRQGCVEGRLARDGRQAQLNLAEPLGRDVAAGGEASVINHVRYYVKTERDGTRRLMRSVDGGANPLIGEITRFHLTYLDRDGVPTTDPSRVVSLRVEAAVGGEPVPVVQDIGLRGR